MVSTLITSKSNSLFEKLPRVIIENDIFTYLGTNDLFFKVRPVCIEWFDLMKNLWCTKIKEEMLDQVKMIDLIYEKEVLTKTVEFKLEYLLNYKNLLTLYNSNTNVLELIFKAFAESQHEEEHLKLFALYFTFFKMDEPVNFIVYNNIESLGVFVADEQNIEEYKAKFDFVINGEIFHEPTGIDLLSYREIFSGINKEVIETNGDNSKIIYSLLQGLIEYEILKHDINELKKKHQTLVKKIQDSTNAWPKKKKFFENAYKLMLYTK